MTASPATLAESVEDWRYQHKHAATSLEDVERLFPGRFELSDLDRASIAAAIALYGMRATPYYIGLARRASEQDPIWALAVPSPRELRRTAEERDDPIGDEAPGLHPLPGLTRRYPDRALLYPTPVCSVHCRHCFRKRMIGRAEYALDEQAVQAALDWIAGQTELREVILTGGDPLTLSDDRLLAILRRLDALPQLRTLRIHTRMLVVNPFRLTEALAEALGSLSKPLFLVSHFNHPVEVTPAARAAAGRLHARGVTLLNQSVLLAGINDEPEVHRALLFALLESRIRPYALHHADLVPGTGHLRTSVQVGYRLMRALRGTVPGHALPQYLLDVPGGHGKIPLDYPWATPGVLGGLRVEAPDGSRHDYGGRASHDSL
ncbi:MAG: KamA family radical SAM protein [Planctomycetota bacterium]